VHPTQYCGSSEVCPKKFSSPLNTNVKWIKPIKLKPTTNIFCDKSVLFVLHFVSHPKYEPQPWSFDGRLHSQRTASLAVWLLLDERWINSKTGCLHVMFRENELSKRLCFANHIHINSLWKTSTKCASSWQRMIKFQFLVCNLCKYWNAIGWISFTVYYGKDMVRFALYMQRCKVFLPWWSTISAMCPFQCSVTSFFAVLLCFYWVLLLEEQIFVSSIWNQTIKICDPI